MIQKEMSSTSKLKKRNVLSRAGTNVIGKNIIFKITDTRKNIR